MIYNFNLIFYIVLLVQTLLLCTSLFVIGLRSCLCWFGCCCTNLVHAILVIMTLAFRYDSAGN